MVKRQSNGCLCFLRRKHKDGKFVSQGAAGAKSSLQVGSSGRGRHLDTIDSPGGAQLVKSLAPCDTPAATCPANVPQATTLPSPSPCIASAYSSAPPPVSSGSAIQSPTSIPTDPPPEIQPPTDTRTSQLLAASNAAISFEEGPQDTCSLSTTSHVSTVYLSARGSSLFGEDGEWLAGGPPSFPRAASAHADGRPGDHRLHDVSSAVEASGQQQFHLNEHHTLQLSQQNSPVTSQPAQQNPQQHKQSHNHDLPVLCELGAASSGSPTNNGMHTSDKPVAPSCPAGQPSKPFIVVVQEAADAPLDPHQNGNRSFMISHGEEGQPHNEQHPQSLQQQHQLEELQEGDPTCNGTNNASTTSASNTVGSREVGRKDGGAGADQGCASLQGDRNTILDRVTELYGLSGGSCMACQVLLHYCKTQNVAPDTLHPELHARGMPDTEKLTKVAQGVSDALADVASDEGWQVVRNDDLKLLYRHVPGQTVHAFRARCDVQAHVERLVALAREADLCPTWNKYCTSATVLRETSPTDLVAYMSVWMPWPFHDVGFMIEAHGTDLYDEEGRMVICFSTPASKSTGPDALPPPPAGSEKNRKMRLLAPSCITLEPLPPQNPGSPARTRCVIQSYVDPNVRHVPPFIITFVLKVLSPFVYGAVLKVLASAFKSPDNPLPKRIQKRTELYDLVRHRTEAYLKSKAAAAAAER